MPSLSAPSFTFSCRAAIWHFWMQKYEKFHSYFCLNRCQLPDFVSCVGLYNHLYGFLRTSFIVLSCNTRLQYHQWKLACLMTHRLWYQHLRYSTHHSYLVLTWYFTYIRSHLHQSPDNKVKFPILYYWQSSVHHIWYLQWGTKPSNTHW